MNEFRIRSMKIAAYAVAIGCNFPEVVDDGRGVTFAFNDEDGSVREAHREYLLDDPQGLAAQVSAPRLFSAWYALKRELPAKETLR